MRSVPRAPTFYDSPAWRKLRARFLGLHPVCRYCGAEARHVDHVQPVRSRPDLALVWENLQALCPSCHSMKTATYDMSQGKGGRGACDLAGTPLHPEHPWNAARHDREPVRRGPETQQRV